MSCRPGDKQCIKKEFWLRKENSLNKIFAEILNVAYRRWLNRKKKIQMQLFKK